MTANFPYHEQNSPCDRYHEPSIALSTINCCRAHTLQDGIVIIVRKRAGRKDRRSSEGG